jgi:hypothetical protein
MGRQPNGSSWPKDRNQDGVVGLGSTNGVVPDSESACAELGHVVAVKFYRIVRIVVLYAASPCEQLAYVVPLTARKGHVQGNSKAHANGTKGFAWTSQF